MPVPVAYSSTLKETYDSVRLVFEKCKYEDHKWDVSGDLKMVALIMGLQLGRTKTPCFICKWIATQKRINGTEVFDHYAATWELRDELQPGAMNVIRNSLIPKNKMLLPPLHIKLGLVTQFIKTLKKTNPESQAFKYLTELFPRLSKMKLDAGIHCSSNMFVLSIVCYCNNE